MPRSRTAVVGAFVLGGMLLFGLGLFLIGDRRMLFEDNFEVYAEFANISGLQNGAIVRVAGMDAGEVETIHVPTGPAQRFRVKMRIRRDLHQLIRLDSIASIQTDGLVGNKYIQIETGTEQSAMVADGGTIRSVEPFDIADMMKQMNKTIELVNSIIVDLKGSLETALTSITATAQDAQTLMKDVGADARAIMASTQTATRNLNAIIADVRAGRGSVGKLLTDDSLFQSAKNIAAEAEKAVATVREASEQARGAIADFRGEGGPLKGVTGDVQQTLALAREVMSDLADATEALKHSFFFRGFFNRRGYFDLSDVSVDEYRQGALTSKDRRALRIWVAAAVLFEKDPNGPERLSDEGRRRLDSAMTPFLKYPRDTPLVVEGYADGPMAADRFLSSRIRAQLVRDYLVSKFALDPNFVATMPMGPEAQGSPTGERWDGIGLALFVSRPAS